MIDWWGLLANLLWIAGLSIDLAALSMTYYVAQAAQIPLRQELEGLAFQIPFCAGTLLVGWGMLFSGESWWEKVFGGLVMVGCLVLAVHLWNRRRSEREGREKS
jgi:hypothetical protein